MENQMGKGGKTDADFSADTDSWFDKVAATDRLRRNEKVVEAVAITEKEATRDNLEKLRSTIKEIPYSSDIHSAIDGQIKKILDGAYKDEFRFQFGGKRQGHGKVSATSNFFSMFEQAATYGEFSKGGKTGQTYDITVYVTQDDYRKGNGNLIEEGVPSYSEARKIARHEYGTGFYKVVKIESEDKSVINTFGLEMEKGGFIPNNYDGKLAGDVWDSWTKDQKEHFLQDHLPDEVDIFGTHNYISLPVSVQRVVIKHVSRGQYEKGGSMATGGKTKVTYEIKVYPKKADYPKNGVLIEDNIPSESETMRIVKKEIGTGFYKFVEAKSSDGTWEHTEILQENSMATGGIVAFLNKKITLW